MRIGPTPRSVALQINCEHTRSMVNKVPGSYFWRVRLINFKLPAMTVFLPKELD